jgi:olfactory receptor
MAEGNHSAVTGFILAVLSDKPQLQLPLFLLFLGIYLFTVGGEHVIRSDILLLLYSYGY